MPHIIKSTWFALLLSGLLAACAAPTSTQPAGLPTEPPPTQPAPAPTQPEPTQPAPAPTSSPGIPGDQVDIPVKADNETFNATVTGKGDIGVILADTIGYNTWRWLPLVDALDSNANLRMVTFTYRNEDATPNQDTRAVFDYLRAEGINKIVCVGAGYGSSACGYLQNEPEIVGMVVFAVPQMVAIEADFPKLFLTPENGNYVGPAQRAYEQSAEPKTFKSYVAGMDGSALFTDPNVGAQALADVTDFINGIVTGISSEQVVISAEADNDTFNVTITGHGQVGVIIANTIGNDPLRWTPLVDALSSNENLRTVTFAYRDEASDTSNQDTRAVFDYLRAAGIDKIICVGAGYGSSACGYLQIEPEIIGMVLISVDHIAKIEGGFPKLFLTADADPVIAAGQTELVYEHSTEPKLFKSYAAGVHGPALFFKAEVGPQVLADVTDFINEIVSGQ